MWASETQKVLNHTKSEPFVKTEDLDFEFENVFEQYLEDVN